MYREITDTQIAAAMKSGDTIALSVWRAIKTEFVRYQTASAGNTLTDGSELQIISKMVQQRKDSIAQYKSAGRQDLAEVEEKELMILSELMPKEPTESDIEETIKQFVDGRSGNVSMKDMKDVMAHVKNTYPVVNGALVSKIFREKYV